MLQTKVCTGILISTFFTGCYTDCKKMYENKIKDIPIRGVVVGKYRLQPAWNYRYSIKRYGRSCYRLYTRLLLQII